MTEDNRRYGFEVESVQCENTRHFWVVTGEAAAWHCARALDGALVAFNCRHLGGDRSVTFDTGLVHEELTA